jgi:hypothetical protein
MKPLSVRMKEKLIHLPLRERPLWAHYVQEVEALESRLSNKGENEK